MDNPPPQINIIKPEGGSKFQLPRVSPLIIILMTIVLAVVTVVSVALLYQKRNQPVAPTAAPKANASTTQNVSDNFDGAILDTSKWAVTLFAPGATVGTAGQLTFNVPNQTNPNDTIVSSHTVTGDFDVSVDILPASGTATLSFAQSTLISQANITRSKNSGADVLSSSFNNNSSQSKDLGTNVDVVTVRITRVGNVVQTFYKTTGDYVLLNSDLNGYIGDGYFNFVATPLAPSNLGVIVKFDNFSGLYNLAAVQPTPIPGSAAACALTFTVLDTVATGTPGPSATPSSTPTPTPTNTPGPTPTVTSTPPPGATTTPMPTPTPTSIVAIGSTPTPVTLQTAGSMTGTLALGLGGALILGLGAILMLVF